MKFIKYLSIVVIFFLVLVAGLLATLNFVDLDRYKGTLENQISKITGRDFSIEGDSELSISLQPRVLLRDVRLQNAPWGSQPDMLRIGQVELSSASCWVSWSPWPLIRQAIVRPRCTLASSTKPKTSAPAAA